MLDKLLEDADGTIGEMLAGYRPCLVEGEIGRLLEVEKGIARVSGLPRVQAMELVHFGNGVAGLAFNLDPDQVGVVVLGDYSGLRAGMAVARSGRVVDVPVGPALLGRVVDSLGRALDGAGEPAAEQRLPVEREAPAIMQRTAVATPLETGIKAIDALIPVGRGQRQLILGDRQTGKTAIAVDTMLNLVDKNVICVYCAIGQRGDAVARVLARLRAAQAMGHCVVVVGECDAAAGLQFIAPYAATTIAEYFAERGRDTLVVYDDLTRHAHAYRELSLLLRRPPGREAYPGDIFYIHSRLLERATHLRVEAGGGSLSAFPIIETQAQNLSAYIPTNLISITDGQIYLSPELFQKGELPAVEVGRSVSRVGGKAQLRAYQTVSGELRLAYSQFLELETFARFGTRLDDRTRATIEHGRRIREILKQQEGDAYHACEQIVVLLALCRGLFDSIPLGRVRDAEHALRQAAAGEMTEFCQRVRANEALPEAAIEAMLKRARELLQRWIEPGAGHADP